MVLEPHLRCPQVGDLQSLRCVNSSDSDARLADPVNPACNLGAGKGVIPDRSRGTACRTTRFKSPRDGHVWTNRRRTRCPGAGEHARPAVRGGVDPGNGAGMRDYSADDRNRSD
jgi:hypothetical protein